MAKELKDFTQLLIDTVRVGKKVVKEIPDQPIKLFDYIPDLKEQFEQIDAFNKNDAMFEQAGDEEKEQFSETLEKFLAYTDKHMRDEKSTLRPMFNQEQIMSVIADLEIRYEKLNG